MVLIVLMHSVGVTQAEFGFLALVPHHVRSVGLKALDLTGSSHLEAFLGTGMRFHFRHNTVYFSKESQR